MIEHYFTNEQVANESGGKTDAVRFRLDLVDPEAMLRLGHVLATGAERHGEENWRKLSSREHLNKALGHIYAHIGGDTGDDHLGHAFCRLMMACATETEKPDPRTT